MYIYIYIDAVLFLATDVLQFYFSLQKNHHHHDVVPLARISLTLSRHFSLSFLACFDGIKFLFFDELIIIKL